MKVIHFITDEKHLNTTIDLFEDIKELENRYIVVTYDDETPSFRFLESKKVEMIHISEINTIISSHSICDTIVIHNLCSLPCEYIKDINKKIKVVWFSWGFDIYANQYPQFKLIKLKNRIKHKTITFRYRLRLLNESRRLFISNLLNKKRKEQKAFVAAIHRIDYYSGVYPIEYDYLKKNSFFRAKRIYFNYPPKKNQYDINFLTTDIHPTNNYIQIGNCGTKLGNHGNTFWRLKNIDLQNRKVIVPLSYAGDSLYRSIVHKKGQEFLGENFFPLTSFMKIDDYFKLIKSASIAIHNVEQQAAVGNILVNIWNGTKVFLPESSLNYQFFKSLGFHIFTIENDLNQTEIDTVLSDSDIIDNRNKIIQHFSFESIRNKVRNSFLTIEQSLHDN